MSRRRVRKKVEAHLERAEKLGEKAERILVAVNRLCGTMRELTQAVSGFTRAAADGTMTGEEARGWAVKLNEACKPVAPAVEEITRITSERHGRVRRGRLR